MPQKLQRLMLNMLGAASCVALCTAMLPVATAQAATKAKASKQAKASARSKQRATALAQDTVEQVNAAQLDVAARVLTGSADCEFNQRVHIEPASGQPGHFHVQFAKARYTMVPQETTTGAVRLEDRRAGVIWLQIPSKSMLMNARLGQRMVDACTVAEQRAAVNAVQQATGIGITPTPVTATTVSTPAEAAAGVAPLQPLPEAAAQPASAATH